MLWTSLEQSLKAPHLEVVADDDLAAEGEVVARDVGDVVPLQVLETAAPSVSTVLNASVTTAVRPAKPQLSHVTTQQ